MKDLAFGLKELKSKNPQASSGWEKGVSRYPERTAFIEDAGKTYGMEDNGMYYALLVWEHGSWSEIYWDDIQADSKLEAIYSMLHSVASK